MTLWCFGAALWLAALLARPVLGGPASAEPPEPAPEPVAAEEYPIYNRVVDGKFLTSQTEIVFIGQVTVIHLGPGEEDRPSRAYFRERGLFAGLLEPALLTDFIIKNSRPGRLEEKFNFGVRYRFVPGDGDDMHGPEVSLAPIPVAATAAEEARLVQEAPRLIGVLRFSRVGFTPRQDKALVYVEEERADGTGSGFLILLARRTRSWDFVDTEVLWVTRPE